MKTDEHATAADLHAAEIAYLEEHWESMGLEYVDDGDRTRISQPRDVSGSWRVEYYGGGKWHERRGSRSDFESLAIAKMVLRDRLEETLNPCSIEWNTIDEGILTIITADKWTTLGVLVEAGWSERYRAPTEIEALHKATEHLAPSVPEDRSLEPEASPSPGSDS